MWTVAIWLESFRCARILLRQWQGEYFVHRQHFWNFATFNLYTVRAKIIYLQSFSTDCRNLSHKFDDVDGGHLCGKFQVRSCFTFAMGNWKLCASTTFEILPLFNLYTVPAKILYLQRYSTDFWNPCLSSKMLRVGIWVLSFNVRRYFPFAIARWKLGASTTFQILPTFKLYTVQAEILYLQRYSTDCWNLSFSSNMLTVAIWVESFRCAGILLLQWQGEYLAHRQPLKFYHVQPVHCASKNPISPKVFNRLSKSFPQLEDVDDGHLGGKLQVRRYFSFAMAKWKLCAATIFEILPLSSCTLCQQKSYISKGIQPTFWNLPLSSKILRVGIWVKSFKGVGILHFAVARWKLGALTTFQILARSTCTRCKQKSYISKGIQPIVEIFAFI